MLAIRRVTRQVIPVPCLVELAMANLPPETVRALFLETPVQHLDLATATLLRQLPVENPARVYLAPEHLEQLGLVTVSHQQELPALRPEFQGKGLLALAMVQLRAALVERALPALEQFREAKDFLVARAFLVAKEPPAPVAAVDRSRRLPRLELRNILRSTWSRD